MLIEQPPYMYRMLYPETIWRIPRKSKTVYLTFDDGPVPEVTPWVLNVLDHYNIKATFFCVGDNVARHKELYQEILKRGHLTGNHTQNHIQGMRYRTKNYLRNVEAANTLIDSPLFRPPHGHMRFRQKMALQKAGYHIIMWDVVSRDYSKNLTPNEVVENVRKYTRNGSIIVFHDSLKAQRNLKEALPKAIEWLIKEGYQIKKLPFNFIISE
ncbi:MAG: polysaccharide deacetylase family protein [Muribaculaceae bacterium]|nr:polysaccharide deacetylase family protein [Muribaculaceae bacterium]